MAFLSKMFNTLVNGYIHISDTTPEILHSCDVLEVLSDIIKVKQGILDVNMKFSAFLVRFPSSPLPTVILDSGLSDTQEVSC